MQQLDHHNHKLLTPFNGIREVIRKLSKKAVIYIITSNLTSVIEDSIQFHKIKGVQRVIGGDKEFSKVKKILAVKKIHPKAVFYYIGDTVGDILEAKKADVKAVAVTWGYHSRKMLEKVKPDYIVDTPKELLKVLLKA